MRVNTKTQFERPMISNDQLVAAVVESLSGKVGIGGGFLEGCVRINHFGAEALHRVAVGELLPGARLLLFGQTELVEDGSGDRPGAHAFTHTPLGSSSVERVRASDRRPAFDMA